MCRRRALSAVLVARAYTNYAILFQFAARLDCARVSTAGGAPGASAARHTRRPHTFFTTLRPTPASRHATLDRITAEQNTNRGLKPLIKLFLHYLIRHLFQNGGKKMFMRE